jgi:hypothetical protein
VRVFVERWHDLEAQAALDVFFDEGLARYEVVAGELVVFTSAHLVEVLFWCMGMPRSTTATTVEPIDLVE